MAANKTQATEESVSAFLDRIPEPQRRADCQALIRIMQKETGEKPRMWGSSIVGFGSYHYRYESGREGDMCRLGFSPRKNDLTLYLYGLDQQPEQLRKLGKCKTGKACLYLRGLPGVDEEALIEMIRFSLRTLDGMIASNGWSNNRMRKAE